MVYDGLLCLYLILAYLNSNHFPISHLDTQEDQAQLVLSSVKLVYKMKSFRLVILIANRDFSDHVCNNNNGMQSVSN